VLSFFSSWFANPSVLGIALAVVFGAVWLVCFWPLLFRRPWLWAVLIGSAILTLVAVTFVQIPQARASYWGRGRGRIWYF
jgi:hypothetical protein